MATQGYEGALKTAQGYEGALKTALENMRAYQRDSLVGDDPMFATMVTVLEAMLAPHPDLQVHSQRIDQCENRARDTDRDLGTVAERLAAVERGRTLVSDTAALAGKVHRLTTDLRGAEGAIGELAKLFADECAARRGDLGNTAGDDSVVIGTLAIDHLHIGEHLDATGAQLGGEDPDRMVFGGLIAQLRVRCNADVEAVSKDAHAALRLAAKPLGWSVAAPITGDTLRQAIDRLVSERDQAHSERDQLKARAGDLATELEKWMQALATHLKCVPSQDAILRGAIIMARRAGELDEQRASRTTTIDAQSKQIADLERQLAVANAALDASKAHGLRMEEMDRSSRGRADTTQAQLDKFMSACADQTIQIMELRGRVRALGGNPTEGPELYDVPEPDHQDGIDRQLAIAALIAVMPEWARGAESVPLTYESPLLKAWARLKAILAPAAADDDGFAEAAANEGARIAAAESDPASGD